MKRIYEFALVVAGVYEEYQHGIINGILDFANTHQINISCFTGFNDTALDSKFNIGENFIYTVADYNKFDAVILMLNTITDSMTKQQIVDKVKSSRKPTVIFDYSGEPSFINFTINNFDAMKQLVSHVIEKHKVSKICFISGPKNNPEAMDRFRAFKEACKEHDIIDTYVYNGTFRPSDGRAAVRAILKDKFIPDAIISSNDAMAISALEELNARGYKVPKDVIVTGFDHTFSAQYSSPSITTVKRPLMELGYTICETLIKVINNETVKSVYKLDAQVVYGESCGCNIQNYDDIVTYKRMVSYKLTNTNHDILAVNNLIPRLSTHNNIESFAEDIVPFIKEIDCDKFCICLYDTHPKINRATASFVWMNDNYSINVPLDKGELDPIPFTNGGNISYYFPLHYGNSILGYIIISNSDFPLRSFGSHTLSMSLSTIIENIYKINNLDAAYAEINNLYVTDQLCGIYNRYGMIKASKNILHKCKQRKSDLFISFIDMDGLKSINDKYGHKEGDFSIKSIAIALKHSCNSDTICARFGGDEFIAIGVGNDFNTFENTFHDKLKEVNARSNKEFTIQASIGSIVSSVDDNTDLFKLISKADSIMYEQKKKKKTSRYIRKDD